MRFGLRGRLVVALVATSVATLATAALVVLPVLEQRLESDRLAELRGLARTIRPTLLRVPEGELRPGSPRLRRIADHLQRQTGGRIVLYAEDGAPLADTALAGAPPPVTDLALESEKARRHRTGVISGEHGGRAFAVAVARSDGDRLTLVIAKRLDDTRAAARVVRAALLPALLAGLLVALVLALLVTRSLLRRLGRLRDDAEALGSEGLSHRVAVAGADEVSVVAGALEQMRGRLVDEEASRQAFVSTASHELRTPLAALQATLELLAEEVQRGDADAATTAARAETALRQTHRLVGLATDLLDLSRVDGDVPLEPEPLDLTELARTIAPEFTARYGGRPLRVEGDPAVALADPAAAARILRVLLDNAGRYGAGTVDVSVQAEDGRVLLAVSDQGRGVDADERDRVFLRFTRGRAGAGTPGAGLGLSIARGLARAMGGDVQAAGARFEVSLPRWTDEEPTAR